MTRIGLEAFCVYTEVPGKGYWYRVFIGRFQSEEEARTEAARLKESGITQYAAVMKLE